MDTKKLMAGALAGFLMIGASAPSRANPLANGGNGASQAPPNGASSSSTLKVKSFSALGTGTFGTDVVGTCFGEVCNASSGNCQCITYGGTTKAPILGQSTWTADFTTNTDNITPTGNGGFCFPSEGELTITSAKGDIKAELSGPLCENALGGTSLFFQYGQAFQIDPTLSDGAALGLNGGGSFSLSSAYITGGGLSGFTTMSAVGFSAK